MSVCVFLASSYSVRTSKTFDALVERFDEQEEVKNEMLLSPGSTNMSKPQMANIEEKLSFPDPYKDADTVYVAIKTKDDSNQVSGLSNVVAVYMKETCTCKLSEAVCTDTYGKKCCYKFFNIKNDYLTSQF